MKHIYITDKIKVKQQVGIKFPIFRQTSFLRGLFVTTKLYIYIYLYAKKRTHAHKRRKEKKKTRTTELYKGPAGRTDKDVFLEQICTLLYPYTQGKLNINCIHPQ